MTSLSLVGTRAEADDDIVRLRSRDRRNVAVLVRNNIAKLF
jgi:hypothetical protein